MSSSSRSKVESDRKGARNERMRKKKVDHVKMRNLWKFNLFDSKVDENVNDVICNNFIDVRGEKGFDGYAE